MIKNVARGVLRRCLPVLLALVLIAVPASAGVHRSPAGPPAVVASASQSGSVEQAHGASADKAETAGAVIDREQFLTSQSTVSVGVSRAPPAAAV
ncbi:hypothetical protein [Actinoplanes sp. NPDC020271]|uniref:hypothetical protein n=1 Tax=Actinoplanes sp. NPDC020271 TaxID=3363896 RepID=UPI00379056BF